MACPEFVFWIGAGDREERKKKSKESLSYRAGFRMEFRIKIKILQLVQWKSEQNSE
jgi:hypothetical protein